jgi:hypothetical protein
MRGRGRVRREGGGEGSGGPREGCARSTVNECSFCGGENARSE